MARKSLRSQDPYLERERARYQHPLPSREYILRILTAEGVPTGEETLAQRLAIQDEEREAFRRRLRAMEHDGEIMRNRKDALCLPTKLDLIKGRVEGHPDGFGFLIPDDASPDLFLGPKQMHKVLHGDRVMARVIGQDRRGRLEGAIVEVLEHVNQRIVGRVFEHHGILFVVAEDKRLSQDILIAPGASAGAKSGQVVEIELISQPRKHAEPIARVVRVLGNYADPGMEVEIALRKHALPHIFSPEVAAHAKRLPRAVAKKDLHGREDLRALPLVTIDGESARDFDDAVYCEPKDTRQGRSHRLIVAIADVSHYVQPQDALDREAYQRGNSVYFPRRVIPMLPEELSNGLCSLNPQVDRLCLACEMDIDAHGKIRRYRFFAAVMHSAARLTYTEVAAALAGAGTPRPEVRELLPQLRALHELYLIFAKARRTRGAIEFETTETELQFDPQGKIEFIRALQRNDAHRLIEECMLAANVCASEFLRKHRRGTLYRVHEGPTAEKLEALREFLREFGLSLGGGDRPHAKDYAAVLEQVKDKPYTQLLQTVMLRSLQQAIYSPTNKGHFGLAYEAYTHFTSPIRRYPDLLVHRTIKAALAGERAGKFNWEEVGKHCSATERRADEATRDVVAWLKCYYMQDRIGEEYSGTVTGVTGFGLFVTLDDLYVDGLVHVSELGNDYYHFDAAKHRLLGERTRTQYRLADRVRVKLVRVDVETSKIDFVLLDAEPRRHPRASSSR